MATLEQVEFAEEAKSQRICAGEGCRANWPWHPHHVVKRQDLESKLGLSKYNEADHVILWDPRNCLRLCPDCHMNHHGLHKLPLKVLTEKNYEFAFEFLREGAGEYLRHHYDDEDPRLDQWERDWQQRIPG